MPAGEHAGEHAVDDLAVADDDLADLLAQRPDVSLKFLDFDLRRRLLALVHFVGFLCAMRVDCREPRERPYSRGRMRSK